MSCGLIVTYINNTFIPGFTETVTYSKKNLVLVPSSQSDNKKTYVRAL